MAMIEFLLWPFLMYFCCELSQQPIVLGGRSRCSRRSSEGSRVLNQECLGGRLVALLVALVVLQAGLWGFGAPRRKRRRGRSKAINK